jgi:hypothetical protein
MAWPLSGKKRKTLKDLCYDDLDSIDLTTTPFYMLLETVSRKRKAQESYQRKGQKPIQQDPK